jgi:hypothetical protein
MAFLIILTNRKKYSLFFNTLKWLFPVCSFLAKQYFSLFFQRQEHLKETGWLGMIFHMDILVLKPERLKLAKQKKILLL